MTLKMQNFKQIMQNKQTRNRMEMHENNESIKKLNAYFGPVLA